MSEWTKTDADNLPWGEVVEVRWPQYSEQAVKCEPSMDENTDGKYPVWSGKHYDQDIDGSEWRRLDIGREDENAAD